MPISLGTLFCSPSDVWDVLSIEGVDLREDDANLATGQIITTSADTSPGSTTMTVASLPVPLLAGSQLTFEGAGMPVPITVSLTAAAVYGSTTLNILQVVNNGSAVSGAPTITDIPAGAAARESGVNAATGMRLIIGARKGTSKVKLYCNQRYDDTQLKLSGTVLDWTTIVAAKFLCERRAQGCPKGLKGSYDEALEEMRMVQNGQLTIEDIGSRGVDWPSIVNVTVRPGHDLMQSCVEPGISEQTPTAYSQYVDWNSACQIWY